MSHTIGFKVDCQYGIIELIPFNIFRRTRELFTVLKVDT